MSYASWLFSENSIIHPASLTPIASEWSLCIFNGPETALFTNAITIGNLKLDAIYIISHINDNPFADVAVIALAPAADAPIVADIALCSLSTATNSVSTSPFATNVEKYCGISVDGVIGNAATTSGLICFIAIAVASFPLNLSLILIIQHPPLSFLLH